MVITRKDFLKVFRLRLGQGLLVKYMPDQPMLSMVMILVEIREAEELT